MAKLSRTVVGRILPLGVVIGALVVSAGPAVAADVSGSGSDPSATVSLVDDRPQTITYEEVVAKDGLPLLVHNDSARPQNVTVRVVGLVDSPDAAVRKLLSDQPLLKRKMRPGGSALARIPLGDVTAADLATAQPFSALIVANGQTGGLARRALNLTPGSVAAAPAGVTDGRLSPTFTPDLTLTAVNYIPSPLGALRPFLLILAALSAIIALLARFGAIRVFQARTFATLAALLVGAFGVWTALDGDWTTGPSLHAISSRTIPVSDTVTPGTVGFASSDDGAIARLEVDGDHRLRPQGLEGAAEFTGVYDLNPSDETAGAAATVDVRDWWPWAALLITLGVLLGVWLRNWYQHVRPQSQLRLRLTDLQRRTLPLLTSAIVDANVDLGEVMSRRLAQLVERVEELIANGDDAAAAKLIDAVEAQLNRLGAIRDAAIALDRTARQVHDLATADGLADAEVRLLPGAWALLEAAREGADLTTLDADELAARQKALETSAALLGRAATLHGTITLHRERTKALLRAAPVNPETSAALSTLLQRLDAYALQSLQADDPAEFAEIEKGDDEAARYLAALSRVEVEAEVGLVVVDTTQWPLRLGADRDTYNVRFERPRRRAEVFWTVVAARDGDASVHRDDLVEVAAQVTPWPDASLTAVEFSDSEGTRRTAPIDAAGRAFDHHTASRPGALRVAAHAVPSGERLGDSSFTVGDSTRASSQRLALSEKDRAVALIAGILAVGSGLISLYVSDPWWGETSDYLAAALWGAVTAEGVKLAVAIADKVWPAGG